MDKDTTHQQMRPRYRNLGRGEKVRHIVSYSELTSSLQERIGVDLTEHELLDKINFALDRIIAHLEEITDEEFSVEDVTEWL